MDSLEQFSVHFFLDVIFVCFQIWVILIIYIFIWFVVHELLIEFLYETRHHTFHMYSFRGFSRCLLKFFLLFNNIHTINIFQIVIEYIFFLCNFLSTFLTIFFLIFIFMIISVFFLIVLLFCGSLYLP